MTRYNRLAKGVVCKIAAGTFKRVQIAPIAEITGWYRLEEIKATLKIPHSDDRMEGQISSQEDRLPEEINS